MKHPELNIRRNRDDTPGRDRPLPEGRINCIVGFVCTGVYTLVAAWDFVERFDRYSNPWPSLVFRVLMFLWLLYLCVSTWRRYRKKQKAVSEEADGKDG